MIRTIGGKLILGLRLTGQHRGTFRKNSPANSMSPKESGRATPSTAKSLTKKWRTTMLFNTAWNKTPEVQPQSDLLSTASLVAWLEKQPAGNCYSYSSPYYCLLAKYFMDHGKHG